MFGCYKQGLTDHPNKSLEDSSAENHENYGISAPEILRRTILASRIGTILVIFFWQRMWLLSAFVLRHTSPFDFRILKMHA